MKKIVLKLGDYIPFYTKKNEKWYTFVRNIILGITNTLYRLLKSEIAGFFYWTKRFWFYLPNECFRVKPYIKDLFRSTVLSETRDYMIRLSETKLEKKNVKLNNMCMFYNIYGVK